MDFKMRGAYTALFTPFRDGRVDEEALRKLVDRQIDGGIDGLVPCGTTGEAATMSVREQILVIETVVDQVNGRVPVIAGTGSNDTARTVKFTRQIAELGDVDAALVVTPYYNKPGQEALVRHYRTVADEGGLPVVLYNVPGRTGVSMTPATVAAIAEHEQVVAIKEASGDMVLATRIIEEAGRNITLFSGDDFTTLPLLSVGGEGCISVVANLDPGIMSEMCAAARSDAWDRARKLHLAIQPLARALFADANPVPLKTAAEILGWSSADVRAPLYRPNEAVREQVRDALERYGMLRDV